MVLNLGKYFDEIYVTTGVIAIRVKTRLRVEGVSCTPAKFS